MSTAVVAAAGMWSVAQAPLVRAFAVIDVTQPPYNAVGDGVTINNQAINAAVADAVPGDEIFFPEGVYAVEGTFVFTKSLTFRGVGAKIKNVGEAPNGDFINISANNFSVIDLIFNDQTSGRITGSLLKFASGFSGGWVQGCTFNASDATAVTFVNHTNGTADDNLITPIVAGVSLRGACAAVTVTRNNIRNWKQRGIVATGTADGTVSNLTIDNNWVAELAPGETGRSPIQINPSVPGAQASQIQVSNNTIVGNDTSFTDTVNPGTADQIQVKNSVDFEVFGNTSILGGDVGITIGPSSSQGFVHDNICRFADTAGIVVSSDSSDLDVLNNECRNNGQNRQINRLDRARAGIFVINSNSPDINIGGNTCGDNQAEKTQCFGISLLCSSDVTLGTNTDAGNNNKTAFIHKEC